MCDLAGSERTNRTKADGDRLKEAGILCYHSLALMYVKLVGVARRNIAIFGDLNFRDSRRLGLAFKFELEANRTIDCRDVV